MKPCNILLVEDNRGDVLMVNRALQEHHIPCQLHVAKDGAEALEFVSRMGEPENPPCPDLLLLDINLPKISGLEVLEEFRRHPKCTRTPVILVSSSGIERDSGQAEKLGVKLYFKKPLDYYEFLKLGGLVRMALEETGNHCG